MRNKWGQEVKWITDKQWSAEGYSTLGGFIALLTLIPIFFIIDRILSMRREYYPVETYITHAECYICHEDSYSKIWPMGPYICSGSHYKEFQERKSS